MWCPNCASEFRESFDRCTDCDRDLVSERPESETEIPEPWIVAGHFYDLPSAQVASDYLNTQGIEAHVLDQHMLGLSWHLVPAMGGCRLEVRVSDNDEALRLLEEAAIPTADPEESPVERAENAEYRAEATEAKRLRGWVALIMAFGPFAILAGLLIKMTGKSNRDDS